ncbi:DNA helicase [Pseudomonas cichorii]|nr:DNA helicase [Pseudomonas cichorii]
MSYNRFGVEVICGAAGSGKTSTALLRLRSLIHLFSTRRERSGDAEPVKILVLTFNRTLAGYLRSLAEHQVEKGESVSLEINTFSKWAMNHLEPFYSPNVQEKRAKIKLIQLASQIGILTPAYVVKEAEYLLGRFESEDLESYIACERTGRGALPRVDKNLRRKILDDVIYPYQVWLKENQWLDWNDVALAMVRDVPSIEYDIVIVDESQDFSANQLRAVRQHLAPDHTITFVIDTVQQVYARGFTWAEAGYEARPERIHVLQANHRNTIEIATFAASVLNGIGVEGNGALPNLTAASTHGPLPIVLRGKYSSQAAWAVEYIKNYIRLNEDSVAFLKPQGGQWFDEISNVLSRNSIPFVDITRGTEWPEGPENVAFSTFHSAKGLEFDYVFILGFNHENTPFAGEEHDDQLLILRKLLAIAIARARKAVIIGYKPGVESQLVQYFGSGTFAEIIV